NDKTGKKSKKKKQDKTRSKSAPSRGRKAKKNSVELDDKAHEKKEKGGTSHADRRQHNTQGVVVRNEIGWIIGQDNFLTVVPKEYKFVLDKRIFEIEMTLTNQTEGTISYFIVNKKNHLGITPPNGFLKCGESTPVTIETGSYDADVL
ncbi:hypothetical protein PFISCL1PPCAC_22914, partial [Pristionchus fissidentatus]